MRERGVTCILCRLHRGDELIPCSGLFDAELFHQRGVGPDPVGRMHVHRRRHPRAVIGGEALQRLRHNIGPVLLSSQIVEICKRAFSGPILDREPEHLHRGRRIASRHPGAQHGHRVRSAAASDGHVHPADALAFQIPFQHVQRRRFAA